MSLRQSRGMSGEWLRGVIAGLVRLISGARPRVVGAQFSERQAIYYANHGSHLDAAVIWAMLPRGLRRQTRPVAARDYWERGRLRRWLAQDIFRAILIDRQGAHGIAASLESIGHSLELGDSLILFPEGTRGNGITVGTFKPGLHHIAQHHPQVELVPVYLQNLNRILPKGEFLPVPLLASATFGPGIQLDPGETRDAFLDRARNALIALTDETSC